MKKYLTKRNAVNLLGFVSFALLSATQMLELDTTVINYILFLVTLIGYFTNDDFRGKNAS